MQDCMAGLLACSGSFLGAGNESFYLLVVLVTNCCWLLGLKENTCNKQASFWPSKLLPCVAPSFLVGQRGAFPLCQFVSSLIFLPFFTSLFSVDRIFNGNRWESSDMSKNNAVPISIPLLNVLAPPRAPLGDLLYKPM
jgi:hypothetical protein